MRNLFQMRNTAIRTLYKLISNSFVPNTRTEVLVSFYIVWPWNKVKRLLFSIIRLDGEVNFFIGKFSQAVFFPCSAVVKTENLEGGFLRSFFSNFLLPVIGDYDQVCLQISCRKWDLVEEIFRGLYFLVRYCKIEIIKANV